MDYHPNIDPKIVDRINKSEEDGGVFLDMLPEDAIIVVRTTNTVYTIDKKASTIEGHAKYCPTPTHFYFNGSTFGGSMIRVNWIGVGMHMEFVISGKPGVIITSPVQHITWSPKKETELQYYQRKLTQAKEIIKYFASHTPSCNAYFNVAGIDECDCGYANLMNEFERD